MAGVDYRCELRRADELIATGHLNHDQPFQIGDEVEIGSRSGIVRTIDPVLGERELRLVIQLSPDRS